jgi:hypothetical protein
MSASKLPHIIEHPTGVFSIEIADGVRIKWWFHNDGKDDHLALHIETHGDDGYRFTDYANNERGTVNGFRIDRRHTPTSMPNA